MKPNAVYYFRHIDETSTRYVLENHTGEEIKDFPATWVRGPNKGGQYIVYRETVDEKVRMEYPFSFSLGTQKVFDKNGKPVTNKQGKQVTKDKMFSGVVPTELYPNMLYGDDRNIGLNDAVLFHFTNNKNRLAVYFFNGQAETAKTKWEQWTAGKTTLAVETITVTPKENPPIVQELTGSSTEVTQYA